MEERWIPVSDESVEIPNTYILLSFSNFTPPCVGRYEKDKQGGGNFYVGDEDEPCSKVGLVVNAWMPLPKPYKD